MNCLGCYVITFASIILALILVRIIDVRLSQIIKQMEESKPSLTELYMGANQQRRIQQRDRTD